MNAKLVPPNNDKGWSLQFFDVPKDIVNQIWYHARTISDHFKLKPFLQGNSDGWMMVEFWDNAEGYILEASLKICEEIGVELDL